ncbi:hypothetical protein GCM10025862_04620 [Arsenicicoccus piscis]|uniref:M28 family peptidase n=1 Tax=Arsenicicoccus piscis TaxID=673954 RepID=A0ABQ6HIS3_9MICO|nr:hypothetical protein GCM10025862_04620 [Arsenicicoccus piscis]
MLALAAALPEPNRDVTFVFYDCEEVDAARNGLGRVATNDPQLLEADFAVLMEPTDGTVEGAARAPSGSRSRPRGSQPIAVDRGWGTTRFTKPEGSSTGCASSRPRPSRSTD